MAEPFLGEIRPFGFNFNPRGWAKCDGQLLPIAQNQALFSLLGTTYGGDGRTTFGLPDLRSRVSMHQGSGPGLSPRSMGQRSGSETNTLTTNNLPAHTHPLQNNAIEAGASTSDPAGNSLAETGLYASGTPDARTLPDTTDPAGGGQAVNNLQPYLVVNYCIALQGVFPSRN